MGSSKSAVTVFFGFIISSSFDGNLNYLTYFFSKKSLSISSKILKGFLNFAESFLFKYSLSDDKKSNESSSF
jgi:hypothetical protein